jgi:hypothetical protein
MADAAGEIIFSAGQHDTDNAELCAALSDP